MNGLANAYLELTALPEVGALLLDARPAVVVGADGSHLLWANGAALHYLGARLSHLLGPGAASREPTVHVPKQALALDDDRPRLEILRFGRAGRGARLPAACRRIALADGSPALLCVAATMPPPPSFGSLAERLAEALAESGALVAVMAESGRVLAAAGRTDELEPLEPAIDRLIEEAGAGDHAFLSRQFDTAAGTRPAAIARAALRNQLAYLIHVGALERLRSEQPPADTPAELSAAVVQDNRPTEPTGAVGVGQRRFVWRTDTDGRIVDVSDALAAVVGADNARLAGLTWTEIGKVLGFSLPVETPRWQGAVAWPVAGTATTVRTEIFASPGTDGGSRGFGLVDEEAAGTDTRTDRLTLTDVWPQPTDEAAPTTDSAMTPEAVEVPWTPDQASVPDQPPEDDAADIDDLMRLDGTAAPPNPPAAGPDTGEDEAGDGGADDLARQSVEANDAPATAPAAETTSESDNVVRLRSGPAERQPLSPPEREAFDRIAESLGGPGERPSPEPPVAEKEGLDETQAPVPTSPVTAAILDRIPIGLLIQQGDGVAFANRNLLETLGYPDLAALRAAGGAAAIFPAAKDGWNGPNLTPHGGRLVAARQGGGSVVANVSLHAVEWAGAAALMLALKPDAGEEDEDAMAEELAVAARRIAELEAVLDTATDGAVVIDRGGTITGINHAAEALFGLETGDLIGQPFTDLLAEESHRAALDYLDGLASNGVASVLNDGREVIGRVPRGGLIPLFMTMGRIGEGGAFCAVLRDITHWKNVEEELLAAKSEAEAANKQKSEFLAKISHEIRTPLNAIIGFSEVMMEERFGPIGSDRYRSYLRDIHTSGEHLMSLINDLLDLSKIEAGKLELAFVAVPINEAIQEAVALMQPQANRERIIIRTSLSGEVPNVVADQRSLRQILLNLLSNAVKFTRAGGQVIVSTSLEDNGEVVVRVRDTGVGMSQKDVEAAMQPFRQVAASKRDDDRGTGLGLPLTKALVEANRATFAIDSAVDQGTLVRITFPTTRVLAG